MVHIDKGIYMYFCQMWCYVQSLQLCMGDGGEVEHWQATISVETYH